MKKGWKYIRYPDLDGESNLLWRYNGVKRIHMSKMNRLDITTDLFISNNYCYKYMNFESYDKNRKMFIIKGDYAYKLIKDKIISELDAFKYIMEN